ncbi:DUF4328 domain-containing protein [Amycolatopsis pigmentata]|uniref:DUF4328 domain-containing protein n=1 Tax=Amycolatopsis pigmentata TaxID=450801 RepID=A0ABW5FSW1_9PSEU
MHGQGEWWRQPGLQQFRPRPRMRWVASVPHGYQARRPRPAERYSGPPSYPFPPRWGFPNLTWREPTTVPGLASGLPSSLERARLLARNAVTVLGFLAGLATAAAGAEFWRYALLVISRNSALDEGVVGMSDTLEIITSLLTVVFGLMALACVLWWLYIVRYALAEENGRRPPRTSWQMLVGILVPVVNLVMAFSIVAELEHAVLNGPADRRPTPSRLVLCWWGAWVVNEVMMAVVLFWRMRSGVQAEADAVLLGGLLDVSAAVLAGLTGFVVYRLSRLISPLPPRRLRQRRVLSVNGAPAPRLRQERPPGASR